MRPELERIQYIEQYLEGKLPPDEVETFEHEMSGNESLKGEVAMQKQISKRIARTELLAQLNVIHQQKFGGKGSKPWWKNIWLNSLLVLVVVGLGAMAIIKSIPVNEEELAREQIENHTEAEPEERLTEESTPGTVVATDESVVDSSASYNTGTRVQSEEKSETFVADTASSVSNLYETDKEDLVLTSSAKNIQEVFTSALDYSKLAPKYDTIYYNQYRGTVHTYKRTGTVIKLPKRLLLRDELNQIKGVGNKNQKNMGDADQKNSRQSPIEEVAVDVSFSDTEDNNAIVKLLYREIKHPAELLNVAFPLETKNGNSHFRYSNKLVFELIPVNAKDQVNPKRTGKISLSFRDRSIRVRDKLYEFTGEQWKQKRNKFKRGTGKNTGLVSLKVANFGLYGLVKPVQQSGLKKISPKFDRQIGKKDLIVIADLTMNSMFECDTLNNIEINPKHKNVLFVFGQKDQLYMVGRKEVSRFQSNNSVPMCLVNITPQVKSYEDVKKVLYKESGSTATNPSVSEFAE